MRTSLRRVIAAAVALATASVAVTAAVGPGLAAPASGVTTSGSPANDDISSRAPANSINIAPLEWFGAGWPSASSSDETTSGFGLAKLYDNTLDAAGTPDAWSTDDNASSATTEATVGMAWPAVVPIQRVVLFPHLGETGYGENFPVEFSITLYSGQDNSSTVVWDSGHLTQTALPTAPFVVDVPTGVNAGGLKLTVYQRRAGATADFKVQLSEIAVFSPIDTPDAHAPAGTQNLAQAADLSVSDTWNSPGDSWDQAYANDGIVNAIQGWTSNSGATTAPIQFTFDLNVSCPTADPPTINQVTVFPRPNRSDFPADFHVEVSTDGTNWSAPASAASTGNPGTTSTPVVLPLDTPTAARYVRVVITLRNSDRATLGEIGVYGTPSVCLDPGKPAVELAPGAAAQLPWSVQGLSNPTVSWTSDDPSVATVKDGTVTAVAVGKTTITMAAGGSHVDIPVTVVKQVEHPGDSFLISAYWPPRKDLLTDAQYKLMADAGIDYIQNVSSTDLTSRATNYEMASLAAKYGMQIGVSDSMFDGATPLTSTPAQIVADMDEYTDVPGVGGFYLKDEPATAMDWANVYTTVKQAAPDYYPYLNFLPYWYGQSHNEEADMRSWAQLAAGRDYLMYDQYPFNGGLADFYQNADLVRKIGLDYGIKTASFLQSYYGPCCSRPTSDQLTFEANTFLAYGYKQLSYFTWVADTPQTIGVLNYDGTKTELYDTVQAIDAEAHGWGPTLMKLDAKEVYLNRGNTYPQAKLPTDFFVQPSADVPMLYSYMRDKTTGQNYLMLVNQSYTDSETASFTFDRDIGSLQAVSPVDSSLSPVALTDHKLTLTFAPGQAKLFALPAGYDYENPPAWSATTTYQAGDKVSYQGKIYLASWSTQNQTPGDPTGPWQELAHASDGSAIWTASRIFNTGDTVTYDGKTWLAAWDTRNQTPGDVNGPWQEIATTSDGTAVWTPTRIFQAGDTASYQGHLYQTDSYTRDQTPGAAGSPWKNIDPKYTFDSDVQGWQAGQNVTGVAQVTSIANGPGTCYSGGCLEAETAPVDETAVRSVYLAPDQPLDMSGDSTFSLEFNSWGGAPGADETTGYEATVTLTGADGSTLTKTFTTGADAWTSLSLDLKGWAGASAVSRVEIGFSSATGSDDWAGSFQIDNVSWQ